MRTLIFVLSFTRSPVDWENALKLKSFDETKLERVCGPPKRGLHTSWRHLSATTGPEHRRLLVPTMPDS